VGGEENAFLGEAVDVGRLVFLLAVAGEVTETEVVGEEVDDVGLRGRVEEKRKREKEAEEFRHGGRFQREESPILFKVKFGESFLKGEGGARFGAEGGVVIFDEIAAGGEGGGGPAGDPGEVVPKEADAGTDEVALVEDAVVTGGRSEAVLAGGAPVLAQGVGEIVEGLVFLFAVGGSESEVEA